MLRHYQCTVTLDIQEVIVKVVFMYACYYQTIKLKEFKIKYLLSMMEKYSLADITHG